MDTWLIFHDYYMLRWSDIGNKQEHIIGFVLLVRDLYLRKIRDTQESISEKTDAFGLRNSCEEPIEKNF
jgi:hypothetical protein